MKFYLVQPGDTLNKIASLYGVAEEEILQANDLEKPDLIQAHQMILIPKSAKNCPFLQQKMVVEIERDGVIATDKCVRSPNGTYTYTVQRGDTLYKIAQRFGTTVATLAALNYIANPNVISPGQVLILPQADTTIYTVKPGDTLYLIAQRFNTTTQSLVQLNNLTNPNLIYPGQVLQVPRGMPAPVPPSPPAPGPTEEYEVRPGDTLYLIAQRFNTTVETLARLNNMANPALIYPGTVILVPVTPSEPGPEPPFLESLWFYVHSPAAWRSLQEHYQSISALVPFWYQITDEGEIIDGTNQQVLDFAKRNNLFVYGLFHNFNGVSFDTKLIDHVLSDAQLRETLIVNIVNLVEEKGLNGVNIDFEFISPENRDNLTLFMNNLYQRMHPQGYVVTIDVLAKESDNPTNRLSGVYDYRALGEAADQVIVLTQDEHYMSFPDPGPIASLPWVKRILDYTVSQIPAEKVKMAAPVYGYDWPIGAPGRLVTYPEVVSLAERYQAEIQFDTESASPYLDYTANGIAHQVWFENAMSFGMKLETAEQYGLGGFASWKLGDEDPAVWAVIEQHN
ncbi:LysM peptidoglycan-binding domain-containing protein [Dehalobacterium formicoaceticum]|uniref:LysM peptidoglycan-binding domain-containing protein n=1 Tax=Dehalobacterium formicoaceticum TaxID=51515 RepID=A0ABT1Y1D2_9FIRM|nr:LysM peptidoglycan-binding domain-containing protein [Dehalobacterium formicoaceticum]MCR6544671.1 LysM peptidoglycan-binding domain-containing protein [Dehalobacterium formicoaceticum]